MNFSEIRPRCKTNNCYANRGGRCMVLENTIFNNTCPFYKPNSETSLEKIEEEIKGYYVKDH